jgi:hypothetical protein
MAPSAVNDGLRTVQAEVAQLITDIRGTIATTGSSNAYNISLATTPSSLADGLFFSFTANHTNTGASTLAVTPGGGSAFTTKAIRKNGASGDAALEAGDIISGNRYEVQYEASANSAAGGYILLNPTPSQVSLTTLGGAPLPMNASGLGNWVSISTPYGSGCVIPAGGTWAYFVFSFDISQNVDTGIVAGVAAGGTTVGAASGTIAWSGVAWRVT